MRKNMGTADRIIRTILAVLIVILVLVGVFKGTFAWLMTVLAVIFLATSYMGFCPLYVLLGIDTLPGKKGKGGRAVPST